MSYLRWLLIVYGSDQPTMTSGFPQNVLVWGQGNDLTWGAGNVLTWG